MMRTPMYESADAAREGRVAGHERTTATTRMEIRQRKIAPTSPEAVDRARERLAELLSGLSAG